MEGILLLYPVEAIVPSEIARLPELYQRLQHFKFSQQQNFSLLLHSHIAQSLPCSTLFA